MMTRADLDEMGEQIAERAANLDAATHGLLSLIRVFDAAGGWSLQNARSCAHWLSWRVGLDLVTAREQVRVARRLGELPLIDEALRLGRVSYTKVRAITRVARPQTEAALLLCAEQETGSQLAITCARLASTQRDGVPAPEELRSHVRTRALPSGQHKLELVGSPDEIAMVMAVIDDSLRRMRDASAEASPALDTPMDTRVDVPRSAHRLRPHPITRADALMAIVHAHARGDRPERSPVELVVVVTDGLGVAADGTVLSPQAVRRVGCDAGVVHLHEDAHGNVLDLGRKRRTVSAAQKRALATRDPQCQFPACPHRAFLEPHHIVHWEDGGETNLSNLVRLCSFHHVCLHEGGYRVELGASRQAHRFFDREGRRIHVVPDPPRGEVTGFDVIAMMNRDRRSIARRTRRGGTASPSISTS
ncbi:MAG: DUF222 domain-containing protein [Proteobacteria bacterium]|nr:DUF222 domain-containing protein [Pseudomonadota bacterium]